METILVPISPGELLDKITILEIKSERITDQDKLANVQLELKLLMTAWEQVGQDDDTIRTLWSDLRAINGELWDIEDDIRDKERDKNFGERFVDLARAVYFTNDRRSDVKKQINVHLGSEIIEEKSYQDYS